MVMGFNHSGIVVKDLQKMIAFYTETLGMKVEREVDSFAPPEGDHTGFPGAKRKLVFVGFPDGSHSMELVHYISPASPAGGLEKHQVNSSHICFNVKDLQAFYDKTSKGAIKFVTPPKFRNIAGGVKVGIIYGYDPEGNLMEFMERTKTA